ncbi:MAG: aspartyl protease family protein [Rickettsiales bacterium]|jgi:aspartyl protease family protein
MNNLLSNHANLIYLGLILFFLILNFISSDKGGIFTALKYISIWIIIILIIIIGYSYRYELKDVKEKVVRELNPGSSTHKQKLRAITINKANDGHFYLNTIINGQKIQFLVDTGASSVALILDDAKKIGINLNEIKFNKVYHTANGKAYGASITLDHVIVDNIKFKKVSASIMSSDMGISLLGMSFLNRLTKFEFKNNNLILYY